MFCIRSSTNPKIRITPQHIHTRLLVQPGKLLAEPRFDFLVQEPLAHAVLGKQVDDAILELRQCQVDVAADGVAGLAADADEEADGVRRGGHVVRRIPVHRLVEEAVAEVVVEGLDAEEEVRVDFEELSRFLVVLAIGPVGFGPEFADALRLQQIANALANAERQFLHRAAVDHHEAAKLAGDFREIFVGHFFDEVFVGGVVVDVVAEGAAAPDAGQAAKEQHFARHLAAILGIANEVHLRYITRRQGCVAAGRFAMDAALRCGGSVEWRIENVERREHFRGWIIPVISWQLFTK